MTLCATVLLARTILHELLECYGWQRQQPADEPNEIRLVPGLVK